ncbi:hypothetical protein K8942_02535 [Candidatus Peribacteria bacterium]|nr:MAG: hypothetical protein K8942_02535 [Candidatus Peribacteria bacterium]
MHSLVLELIHDTEGPCISVYLPVLPGLTHAVENIERLNRMLDDMEGKLQSYGLEGKAKSQFLASARAYADTELASGVDDGSLALFLSPSSFHAVLLSVKTTERLMIGRRFYITPLLSFLFSSMHYFILALSRNTAHFMEVTGTTIESREISGMPHSVAEAWAGMERMEENQQSHSSGNGMSAFHGQGGAKDENEVETKAYVQKIAKSLHAFLHEQHAPLVFAGVEELYGIYKQVDTSGRLLEEYIHGNPDHMQGEDLVTHAEPIVKAAAEKKNVAMLEAYGNVAGTGRTSTELNDILDAAAAGKVETLFVAEGAEQWGTFNTESGKKELHEGPEGDNEELLGLAANHTLKHRGHVVGLPLDTMPEGKQIAAILRF